MKSPEQAEWARSIARDEHTGANVAVKLLQDSGGGEPLERFARKAKVLAELDHPGIVRHVVHGLTDENKPILAMEWLEGEDLAMRLTRGPLGLSETMTLVRPDGNTIPVGARLVDTGRAGSHRGCRCCAGATRRGVYGDAKFAPRGRPETQ